jgi:hypothetical protein|tara:strand:+ start:727 stop:1866 length:1140 start_codon:yes stop_codon:yes gene_type:complete
MNKKEVKEFLKSKPGYLKEPAQRLSDKLECSLDVCKIALKEARIDARAAEDFDLDNVSTSEISEFKKFLKENEIKETDVKSVKFWQNMQGDHRFSVVVKGEDDVIQQTKNDIVSLLESYSPKVEKDYASITKKDAITYEISLPDVHYGKYTGQTLDQAEEEYMNTVKELLSKAEGLNIERILLPIGNDGMNSEGYSRATTKGTPQQDSAEWQETFVGYCNLMVRAVCYLARTAPVDVVVVQGNHDYERMFYAGEFLRAFFLNDERVNIDNSYDSRKYYKYGVNLIMFTHGDKEKPAEMPLIMATEQPLLFAETKFREVHCGHLHKEMVNEYRGIKVRFIPSICANDAWHKMMGYEAKRTGQAHIWSKERGYEGYLQTNI